MELGLRYFDTFEFVKKSKEFGAPEALAEYQVKQIEKAIETAVKIVKDDIHSKELATKKDLLAIEHKLEIKIVESKNQLLIWIFAMLSGFSAFVIGILAKGFHWF